MKKLLLSLIAVLLVFQVFAQKVSLKRPLTYFLPAIEYDPNVPTPEQFFGFQPGEWHLSHDLQYQYMKALAAAAPQRVKLAEYGRSYEHRPLINLYITSPQNHQNLENIRTQHIQLSDPGRSGSLDVSNMPGVLYQGFSIHGNEPSGGNAAPLVAYYLAAGKGAEVEKLLNETVIIFDPCYNPDGFNRFASWVNEHKNRNLTATADDREYNEAWPRGRTNHYWFDLNRDWLPVQHPESTGRIKTFHAWKPNVLTDHHEQGTDATFFFMPGVPSRTNPITPPRNQELTAQMGDFHAAALDKIGSAYFTKESYDDFYYGKGSTYPDANGAVGILFEQASSRGHLQESANGLLDFPFTIRNQVVTALSTHEAMVAMRKEFLEYQRQFYQTALTEARGKGVRAYVLGDGQDPARTAHFLDILLQHQIEVFELSKNTTANGQNFTAGKAYVVPTDQPQYRLIRGIFETQLKFEDSLFYDISSWTLPLAFNLPYSTVTDLSLRGKRVESTASLKTAGTIAKSTYGYLLPWEHYYAPAAANHLLENGLRLKVGTQNFTLNNQKFNPGAILVLVQNQHKTADEIFQLVQEAATRYGTPFVPVNTSLTPEGIDLGSRNFALIKQPKILLVVGEGVNSNDIGEAWHLLDQRYNIVAAKGEISALPRVNLSNYNVIVLADGNYNSISQGSVDKLRDWVSNGGTLIAMQGAVQWLKGRGLSAVEFKQDKDEAKNDRRTYARFEEDFGSNQLPGSIFDVQVDGSHPLAFGYNQPTMPVFRQGNLFFEPSKNKYATPFVHTANPLRSGYVNKKNGDLIKNSAYVVVSGIGSGKVINLADNPNFRAFWFGTNKLFANAIFFGSIISNGTVERPAPPAAPANPARQE
jgi:hypothetical protein